MCRNLFFLLLVQGGLQQPEALNLPDVYTGMGFRVQGLGFSNVEALIIGLGVQGLGVVGGSDWRITWTRTWKMSGNWIRVGACRQNDQ